MSTLSALHGLKRLARDTTRLASGHPHLKRAQTAMNIVLAFSGRPETRDWVDEHFADVEVILSDILELERRATNS